jgi:hypothetical protein
MTAVASSIAYAACEQLQLISASPATVTGAMAAAATPARRRRFISSHKQNPIGDFCLNRGNGFVRISEFGERNRLELERSVEENEVGCFESALDK